MKRAMKHLYDSLRGCAEKEGAKPMSKDKTLTTALAANKSTC